MAYVCEMMLYGIGILFAFLLAGCSVDPYAINAFIQNTSLQVKVCFLVFMAAVLCFYSVSVLCNFGKKYKL
jgi:predicted membrane channel-forming protein YqfA (hemolysin III family)